MNAISRSPKCVPPNKGIEFTAMGERMIYKATVADTDGAYSLAIEITPPGGGLPLHVHHAEDEAMFVLEGAYEVTCGDETFIADRGSFVFIPRDVPNAFRNIEPGPSRMVYITSPGGFETFLETARREPANMFTAAHEHGIEILHLDPKSSE
jgi:mannose-6-phosphate isomerase-like protein (cupin superfamily)